MQAVEGMYHNLNTLQSRSGNQLPFTSVNYGTCIYRMVTKALLEGCIKGVGKVHKTAIFPCGIFQCMKGVNRGEPNYDLYQLALKSTAQRLYPNYANVDWTNADMISTILKHVSTMGCRTYNGFDINGLGYLKDGRKSCVTYYANIGYASKQEEEFTEIFIKKSSWNLLIKIR